MAGKRSKIFVIIYILAVIVLLIFLHYLKILAPVEDKIFEVFASGQSKSYSFFTKLQYSFINYQEAQNLKKENNELKKQLNDAFFENSQLQSYKGENENLRSMLAFKEENKLEIISARVIGQDAQRENTLIIDKGKLDNIAEGLPVIVDKGVIIGKVLAVKDYVSIILLLTDNLSQLAVSTVNSQKSIGLAQGEFGLSLKIELIPQNLPLTENDLIITSGLEQNVPRGLLIGKVNRLISNENELFKSATISPLVDYDEITNLGVIVPEK